jgi:hypothetical protein
MAGLNRNAGSNLRLRESGLLTDVLKTYKIRKVDSGVYTLEKNGNIVLLNTENGCKRSPDFPGFPKLHQ